MKFAPLSAVLVLALPAFAQVSESPPYDTTYNNATLSLDEVACSNGVSSLLTQGYTTLGPLLTFPNLCGVYTMTGWDSAARGTCYKVMCRSTALAVLAADVALDGFNLPEEVITTLTGGLAVELGGVEATAVEVDVSVCGIW